MLEPGRSPGADPDQTGTASVGRPGEADLIAFLNDVLTIAAVRYRRRLGRLVMGNMSGGKTDAAGARRGRRSGMWPMWLCLGGIGILFLLRFIFWR